MFLRPDEIVSWARWNGSAGRSLETPVLEQVLPALHAPNHFANLFVIDNVPLVARDFRKRILPFWLVGPSDHKTYKIIVKITSFHVPN